MAVVEGVASVKNSRVGRGFARADEVGAFEGSEAGVVEGSAVLKIDEANKVVDNALSAMESVHLLVESSLCFCEPSVPSVSEGCLGDVESLPCREGFLDIRLGICTFNASVFGGSGNAYVSVLKDKRGTGFVADDDEGICETRRRRRVLFDGDEGVLGGAVARTVEVFVAVTFVLVVVAVGFVSSREEGGSELGN